MVIDFGYIGTNIVIHALFENDPHAPRCRAILRAIEHGDARATLTFGVIHELSYRLDRTAGMSSRADRAGFLLGLLHYRGMHVPESGIVRQALDRWEQSAVSFVDAYLYAHARHEKRPVCSVNERDFTGVQNSYPGAPTQP
jgi:predicted nucleic acid-binding protein